MTKSEIAQAFSDGQFERCLDYVTDQITWNTPGEQLLTGKSEIEPFCRDIDDYFSSVTTQFKQFNVIENERCVAINGTAEFIREGKTVSFISSCDVYEFDIANGNKILSINSYCITERAKKD